MIKFISVEDTPSTAKSISAVINRILKSKNIEYEVSIFSSSNDALNDIILESNHNKIYILDIELPGKNGIDIAREIRDSGDLESIIIFITAQYDMSMQVLQNNLMAFDFITKKGDYLDKLAQVLTKSIDLVGKKKCLIIEDGNTIFKLNFDEIIYIVTDTNERKTIVRIKDNEYKFNKTIKSYLDDLDERFVLTHRSCIVNRDYVRCLKFSEGLIIFKNGDFLYMLSRSGKKRLKQNAEFFN